MTAPQEPHCEFCAWILEYEEEIRGDGVDVGDTRVTGASEVVTYPWVISLIFASMERDTGHCLREHDPGPFRAVLITLLFGWWKIPFGPVLALAHLGRSMSGGTVTTVDALIRKQRQERWGIVSDAATVIGGFDPANQASVCELTSAAHAEIDRRRLEHGFHEELGVRLLPDDKFQRTCLVQFDYPVGDGNQLVFRSGSLAVLVNYSDTDYFQDGSVDFDGERFVVKESYEIGR